MGIGRWGKGGEEGEGGGRRQKSGGRELTS